MQWNKNKSLVIHSQQNKVCLWKWECKVPKAVELTTKMKSTHLEANAWQAKAIEITRAELQVYHNKYFH